MQDPLSRHNAEGAPMPFIRKARSILPLRVPRPRTPRPVPRTVELEAGLEIVIERLRDHGPFGFRIVTGMIEFAAYDCRWTDEEAEATAVRAAIVRLELDREPTPEE